MEVVGAVVVVTPVRLILADPGIISTDSGFSISVTIPLAIGPVGVAVD